MLFMNWRTYRKPSGKSRQIPANPGKLLDKFFDGRFDKPLGSAESPFSRLFHHALSNLVAQQGTERIQT
jgi:hypothetical protein